jgi:hypothetical protein
MNRIAGRPSFSSIIIGIILLAVGGGLAKTIRYDYGDAIGYWGGIVGAALALGALAFGIGLLIGMSWPRRALLAIVIPVGVLSFEEISKALEPSVGRFPSNAIGALVAVGLCFAISGLAATCFGIRWNQTASRESTTESV